MKEKTIKRWMRRGGVLLLAAGLLLVGGNLWQQFQSNNASQRALEQLEHQIELKNTREQWNSEKEMPTIEDDGEQYIGILRIPALKLELPILSEWSYSKLRIAPCRYQGSVYQGNLILLAHNYSKHFGKLYQLREGDEVTFTDVYGNPFFFTVEKVETLDKIAVEKMKDGDWDLSLFTCTVGGQARMTVRCNLKSSKTS